MEAGSVPDVAFPLRERPAMTYSLRGYDCHAIQMRENFLEITYNNVYDSKWTITMGKLTFSIVAH